MNQTYRYTEIFVTSTPDRSDCIVSCVSEKILRSRKRQFAFRSGIYGLISITSIISIIPAFQYLDTAISRSGFVDYLSLLNSEGLSVMQYWKEFSLTVLESAPTTEILIITSIIFVLIYSARSLAKSFDRLAFHKLQYLSQ